MPALVRLKDIIEALEMQVDEFSSFLDRDTDRVELSPTIFFIRRRIPGETGDPSVPARDDIVISRPREKHAFHPAQLFRSI